MTSKKIIFKIICFVIFSKQVMLVSACTLVEHNPEIINEIILAISLLCFCFAIISLFTIKTSAKKNQRKYWVGFIAGIVIGLVLLA